VPAEADEIREMLTTAATADVITRILFWIFDPR
jgi:hypothetical protein